MDLDVISLLKDGTADLILWLVDIVLRFGLC